MLDRNMWVCYSSQSKVRKVNQQNPMYPGPEEETPEVKPEEGSIGEFNPTPGGDPAPSLEPPDILAADQFP